MKILAITDIHKDYKAARAAGNCEHPDLVLDCGDHDQVVNFFGNCPHFYIRGNHEPQIISCAKDNLPTPNYIPNGTVIEFSMDRIQLPSPALMETTDHAKELLMSVHTYSPF